ncbi:MAG: hypothetical protein EKK46_04710 [Rhodocyclaceae bacterium]|nr:MAG: hypothetical protein EKK46_04710 [Rhodocyclaceae bacterium]
MTTYKDVLCLLAIFVVYGIVGRLDYEDAVRLEQTRQERQHVTCLTAAPSDRETLARINTLSLDSTIRVTNEALPDAGQPCLSRTL